MWSAKAEREEEPGEAEQERALTCRSRGEIMNRFCAYFRLEIQRYCLLALTWMMFIDQFFSCSFSLGLSVSPVNRPQFSLFRRGHILAWVSMDRSMLWLVQLIITLKFK